MLCLDELLRLVPLVFAHLALNLAENLLSTWDKSMNSVYSFWPSVRGEAPQKASESWDPAKQDTAPGTTGNNSVQQTSQWVHHQ